MLIKDIKVGHYRIPLPTVLSDSTHGDMSNFELITVRLYSDAGAEGVGYTYTVGSGGDAVRSLIERDLKPLLINADPRRIEQLWEQMWWRLHYVGRGGIAVFAISAVDIALWDMKGRKQGNPFGDYWVATATKSRPMQAGLTCSFLWKNFVSKPELI